MKKSKRRRGLIYDTSVVAGRALRLLPRDTAEYVPPFFAGVFTYVITVGALQQVASFSDIGIDYKAFQLPVGILFAITGLSRAYSLVTDIQGGYFDRLVLSPVKRLAILLGLMAADAVLVGLLAVIMLVLGLIIGVEFDTGIGGMAVFVLLCSAWALAFAGFPYAIALRTGSPGAVAGSWVLAFPFLLLTTTFVPRSAMAGWLSAVAAWNPATYLLDGLRSLFVEWDGVELLKAVAAIAAVAVVALSLAFSALRSRTRPD
jgi:ABC-2 type transport system permease protein